MMNLRLKERTTLRKHRRDLRQILRSHTVSRLPRREALTVSRQSIIRSAIARMKSTRLGCAIVVDSGERPLGTFTERSVVSLLVNNPQALDTRPVGEHLDSKWIVVQESDPILAVFESMQSKDARYAVITNAEGRTIGLTGQKSMMDYIASLYPPRNDSQRSRRNAIGRHREGAVERVWIEQPVASIQSAPFASVHPNTKVVEAINKLHVTSIACLLISQAEHLLGIFTFRDILNKVAENYEKVRNKSVHDFMTPSPSFVYDTDSSRCALSLMVSQGYRHVPLLDSQERLVGIVGPQRVSNFLLKHL